MPETAIHEQNHSFASEDKVGFAQKVLMSPPTFYARSAKQVCEPHFCAAIAPRFDGGHDGRARFFVEHVGHFALPITLFHSIESLLGRSGNGLIVIGYQFMGKRNR